jgi:aldose 1-epimerase
MQIMRSHAALVMLAAALAGAGGCRQSNHMPQSAPRVTQEPFGRTGDGRIIDLVTLRNQNGMEVRAMTYGGIIVSLRVPDRRKVPGDVVLGHDGAAGYLHNPAYLGAIIGRYANRIGSGAFALDGQQYTLATNNGANHLHGGARGWDQALWTADPFQDARGVGVVFRHTSADGDEGYPGTVRATVTYRLTDDNQFLIDYEATTDKPTVINLAQHSYFNLSAGLSADILGHELTIHADRYTPVDAGLIPTGEIAPVADTPLDFRQSTRIGARINVRDVQLERAGGYDHNFVLNRQGAGLESAVLVSDPASGRTLEVLTTAPGVQFYSGNGLDGSVTGKNGVTYGPRAGLCLETQFFPDSPNHAAFPSTTLRPGTTFRAKTVYKFGVRN